MAADYSDEVKLETRPVKTCFERLFAGIISRLPYQSILFFNFLNESLNYRLPKYMSPVSQYFILKKTVSIGRNKVLRMLTSIL